MEIKQNSIIKESKTKPPHMYSQNEIIKIMQNRKLGTKSTRHGYFEILEKRGFIDNRLNVKKTGICLTKILEKYMDSFLSEKFTTEMQKELQQVQKNPLLLSDIYNKYKTILKEKVKILKSKKDEISNTYNEIYQT